MGINNLSPKLLNKMDAYWRAANYLSVGQLYLCMFHISLSLSYVVILSF